MEVLIRPDKAYDNWYQVVIMIDAMPYDSRQSYHGLAAAEAAKEALIAHLMQRGIK